jgi:hypothetical protein
VYLCLYAAARHRTCAGALRRGAPSTRRLRALDLPCGWNAHATIAARRSGSRLGDQRGARPGAIG